MSCTDEHVAAYKLLESFHDENNIFLFDRGFPSVALIQKLNDKRFKFVARVSTSFIREVDNFNSSQSLDETVRVDYTAKRARQSRVKNLRVPYFFELRCVKIKLSSGETETLITNLPMDTFTSEDLSHLYSLRWGIEIGFNHLKNALDMESFIGIKENSVKQEFYSILTKYNILMQFVGEAERIAQYNNRKKQLKYEYKINIRKGTAIMIPRFAEVLFASKTKFSKIVNKVIDLMKDFELPVRKNRTFERKFNRSKHSVTYKKNTAVLIS